MRRYFARVKVLEDKVNHLTELLSANECSSNPCRNGGTCVDSYNGYVCNCPSNWEGPHCENDVNECALYAGSAFGCQNGATCTNLQGSYRCDCVANWYGIHCSQQHDDCNAASSLELCGHGTCVNEKRVQPGQPKFNCICDPGWKKSSTSPACTEDVNECEELEPKCSKSPRVLCINLPGTYYCGPCPAGYTGNGVWCADVNECENQNGGCSMNPFVDCHNTPGSRRCGPCPAGYFGNGEQCMFQSACNNNRGGCHPLATCIDNPAITVTYRECRCPAGYVGNGEGLNGCTQVQGMSCDNNPCQHGTCQVMGQSYHCVCNPGYYGTHCELQQNTCLSQPCQNGGTCITGQGTFTCNCPNGYSGPTCAEAVRQRCGGYLTANNGTLRYPEGTVYYNHEESCGWVISVDPGKVVNMTFDHFHLEQALDCEHDFLQLNDGPNAGSRVIGRFCSDHLHGETFTSTHNDVYLWFRSDRSVTGTGFLINWKAVDPVCGENLNISEYGSVQSPGYPGRYPLNRTCSWLVQVPFGKRIQLSFATLRLENHVNCSFDYLKVYDGASDSDPVIGTYCTTETPPPLITSGHSATLLFHSDNSVQDVGFNIAYSAIPGIQGCGGTITAPQGTITSPEFPNVYQNNLLCEWLLRIHPDNRLKISFTDFQLESHRNCSYDYVEMYDGSSDASPLLGRFCGTSSPPDILSHSNTVYIRFRSDMSMQHTGFKLEFKTICGGVYTGLTGFMSSPYYPDPYPANSFCIYDIRLPPGYLVNLTINNIEIEHHTNCMFDALEVRDGNSETSPLKALLCGYSAPESIVSTYNRLWMKFVTDGSVQNRGFSAQYEAIEIGCGGIMIEDNGLISSPRHPETYPHSVTCVWLIRAPEAHVIQLSFSTFVLEHDINCNYDYVLIEDTDGVQIGKFCGSTAPPVITSLDNTILVKFVADASVARDGFIASYTFLDASQACGGNYYQESGVIRSPGYPNHYPHAAHCIWVIHGGNGRQITLNVTDFQLEYHTDCRYDFLEIRNGGYETSPLIGKYCGDQITTYIRSHSNVLRLEFKTDSSMSHPGFEIRFDSSAVGCGGTLTTARGSVVSPNYPQPYPLNADCQWLIRVSEGSVISLSIVEIDIEEHTTCLYDYLQIFDGGSENSKSLLRICNNQQNPGHIVSTSNQLLLRFRSDFSEEAGGFHLVYQTVCNTVLKKRRGVIESPNFPNSYPHNHNCSWTIEAPLGSNVSIAFSHIFIESHDNCDLDYVEILEKRENDFVQLGKFCGDMSTPPRTIHTGTNIAIVRLVTDRSVSREGFRLEYTVVGCGGDYYNKHHGVITSPNYPEGYPHDTVCYWHIWYPPESRVVLTLEDVDVEQHTDCEFDFIRVYGGEDETAPRLGNVCNTLSEASIFTTHGSHLFVHFRSDVSVARRGFRASFSQLAGGGCGGRFTADDAYIISPHFPDNYNASDECEWLIEVSSINLVTLQFLDFELPEAVNCSHGYVAIYDGNNSSAPLLLKHCGQKPEGLISSTGNQMYVKLVADGFNVAKGFKAHYMKGCGRRLLADTGGEIHSSNYPAMPVKAGNCSWIIYTSEIGQKISLTVTNLFIRDYDNCSNSVLFVFDGDMDDSPLMGQYCGTRTPPPIVSRGSIMHVVLQNMGIFRATYGLLSEHCGGSYTAASGSFATPGYPTNYDMEMECVWTIEASAGNSVIISFQSFELEDSDFCNSDYVEIHENDPAGRLIGKYCGSRIPSNITAAHKLWIKFRSDDIGTSPGFMAHYELVHGSVLNGTSGDIASPGFPSKYQTEGTYEWTIIAPTEMFVSIQFLKLEITKSGACYGYVKIFDGMGEDAPEMGEYCGYQLPEPVTSTGNVVTVQFQSHHYFQSTFYLRWSAVNESGASLSTDPGSTCLTEYMLQPNATEATTVTSPNFPEYYPNNMNCTYIMRTVNTHHIQVEFETFALEGHSPTCPFDRMNTYIAPNSNVDNWNLNATYCSMIPPFTISVPNNALKLVMTTDGYYSLQGFSAKATAECGGHIYGTNGVLHSSSIYPHVQSLGRYESFQCEWVITVKQRRTIQLHFEEFDVESDNVCSNTYILFRNGAFSTSPILGNGRYCGSNAPQLPQTGSSDVYVQVVYSQTTGRAPVFSLRYTMVQMACGGHIYLSSDIPSSEIFSPNHPNAPTHDVECEWVIISPPGSRMRADFDDQFHIGPNCYSGDNIEYLDLHDGGTETAEVLRRLCGNEPPSSVMTTGNALFVRYLTSLDQPQVGFKATVRIAHCGGTISSFHSIINSPNYPQNYESSIQCEWFLKMKYGYHMTLMITDFETPVSSNCSLTDYLEIRDIDAEGTLLSTLCGRPDSLPITVEIPGSFAYIKFKTNSAHTAKGFTMTMNANFEEGCGGNIESPSGVITSPRYPNALSAPRDCFWAVHAPEGRRVKVVFEAMNLPRDENIGVCTSFVSIFNVTQRYVARSANYTHRYCGNTLPAEIDSTTSSLFISFFTTGLNAGQGFSLRYSTEDEAVCGSALTGPSGVLSSTNFPVQEDTLIDCRWRIDVEENKTLSLRFDYLDMPGIVANFCRDGALVVVGGGRYIGVFCGNYTNGLTITSPYATTKLRMVASLKTPFRGFSGTYNTSNCGGFLDGSNAVITSPGYPNAYPSGTDCHWILNVPYGDIIRLTTQDLRLEEDCSKDYVMVRNGMHLESPVIGKFCGTHNPAPIVSSGEYLVVIFHSDAFGTAPGFKMITADVQRGCGGVVHMLQGNFTSPNYPSRYDSNVECLWTIEYEEGYLVKIDFEGRFNIEMDNTCSKDYLQFEDLENNGRWSAGDKKCGSVAPSSFVSKANKLRVTFHSNERVVGDGFNLKYSATCGGNFTHERGDIHSPNYPSFYGNNLLCKYVIGKAGDYVSLTFDDYFSMEGSTNCIWDYLEIFQQEENANSSQGVYCGTIPPAPRRLQGPLILVFKTDYSYVAHGFKVTYQIFDCNRVLTEPSGLISSPPVLDVHTQDLVCTWQIIAPQDKVIAVRFRHMNVSASYDCWRSHLEIRDGNESSPLIGKFCGPDVPIVKSKGNQLRLRFRHDRYDYFQGDFQLYYYHTFGAAHGCGGTLNGTSGELQSLDIDSDGNYEPNLDCGWLLLANVPDQVIKVTFNRFDLEESRNGTCVSDFLELKEDGSKGPLVGRYCGSAVPPSIISSANRMFVHFRTDDVNNKSGFKLTYTVTQSPCGSSSLISTTIGQTITSPNYPNPYPVNLRCKWIIGVNATTWSDRRPLSVEITMNDLDIPCGDDYLEISQSKMDYMNYYDQRPFRACGDHYPKVTTLRTGAEIFFHSDPINNGAKGFSLTYKDESCSKNISSDGGIVKNSAYPLTYNKKTRCLINITASAGKTISMYFKTFYMGYDTCENSNMKVYDGHNETFPLIDSFCSYSLPNPVFSTGRSLFLDVTMPRGYGYYFMTFIATDKGRGCGGDIIATDGSVSSPLYPLPYNKTGECTWNIKVPGYHTVGIYFSTFSLNSSSGCDVNYVELYDGPTEDISARIARYCGQDTPSYHESRSNQVILKMVTDTTNDQPGFVIYFYSNDIVAEPSGNFVQQEDPSEGGIIY